MIKFIKKKQSATKVLFIFLDAVVVDFVQRKEVFLCYHLPQGAGRTVELCVC
jgi:hypothetical protein